MIESAISKTPISRLRQSYETCVIENQCHWNLVRIYITSSRCMQHDEMAKCHEKFPTQRVAFLRFIKIIFIHQSWFTRYPEALFCLTENHQNLWQFTYRISLAQCRCTIFAILKTFLSKEDNSKWIPESSAPPTGYIPIKIFQ